MKAAVAGADGSTTAPFDDSSPATTTRRPEAHGPTFGSVLKQLVREPVDDHPGASRTQRPRPRREDTKSDLGLVSGSVTCDPTQSPLVAGNTMTEPLPSDSTNPGRAMEPDAIEPTPGPTVSEHAAAEQQIDQAIPRRSGAADPASSAPGLKPATAILVDSTDKGDQPPIRLATEPTKQCSSESTAESNADRTHPGTTGAPLLPDMKLAQNWNEIAADVSTLPGDAATLADAGAAAETRPPPGHMAGLVLLPGTALIDVQRSHPESESQPGLVASPVTRSEPILAGVLREVQLCQQVKADTVSVMLRPDSRTEILLRITLSDGQVQVNARCHRGDFAALDACWGQLRQSLATQGVQLDPLTRSPNDPRVPSLDNGCEAGSGDGHPHRQSSEWLEWTEGQPSPQGLTNHSKRARPNQFRSSSSLEFWA